MILIHIITFVISDTDHECWWKRQRLEIVRFDSP